MTSHCLTYTPPPPPPFHKSLITNTLPHARPARPRRLVVTWAWYRWRRWWITILFVDRENVIKVDKLISSPGRPEGARVDARGQGGFWLPWRRHMMPDQAGGTGGRADRPHVCSCTSAHLESQFPSHVIIHFCIAPKH